MNAKVTLAVLGIIVLGGAGWYAATHPAPLPADQEAAAEGNPVKLEASFACKDGSHFIAQFGISSADIIVDGSTVRTVPQTSDAPITFADAEYSYVFVGEGVTVTAKATGAATTCAQPADPNNAPVNFGDAGEGPGQ